MSFPYPLTQTIEMQMRLFSDESFAEVAERFHITENEVKKRTRILREEICRHCTCTDITEGPVLESKFRAQMLGAMNNLRRRDPDMWKLLFGGSCAAALNTFMNNLEYLCCETLEYDAAELFIGV